MSPSLWAHLSVVNVLTERLQLVEGVVHMHEVGLQDHLHLCNLLLVSLRLKNDIEVCEQGLASRTPALDVLHMRKSSHPFALDSMHKVDSITRSRINTMD